MQIPWDMTWALTKKSSNVLNAMVGVKIGPATTLASDEANVIAKTMKTRCATTVDRV